MELIVIEGTDGSGKATQSAKLVERLKEKYSDVFLVSFPQYGTPGASLVEAYLKGEFGDNPSDVNPYVAGTMYALDRATHFINTKYPDDAILVCDRYTFSNIIHQSNKMNTDVEKVNYRYWAENLEYEMFDIPKPTKQFYLYVPYEKTAKMIEDRAKENNITKDIHEKNMDYMKKCYYGIESYLAGEMYGKVLFKGFNIISCINDKTNELRSIGDISDEIYNEVITYLDSKNK